jgi:peroxiredoxin
MVELGQLEAHQQDFATRQVRVIAASPDSREDTAKTQAEFPHLLILSDADHKLAEAVNVLGPHRGPDGEMTNSPTTVFIDNKGFVRSIVRPQRFLVRLSAEEVLTKVDESLRKR